MSNDSTWLVALIVVVVVVIGLGIAAVIAAVTPAPVSNETLHERC